jgi:hypothetical protein
MPPLPGFLWRAAADLLLHFFHPTTFSCSYNKARSLDAFLEFIKEKLDADKGFARVEALDKLAQAFVADGADKDKVAADVKAAAAKVDKEEAENAKLYVEAIEKAVARVSGVRDAKAYKQVHEARCLP